MIKFVIVDNDEKVVKHIRRLIDEVYKEEKEFLSFSMLTERLKKEINDLDSRKVYILDIELADNFSGISVAKLIRDVDWHSEIIFITNHDKMFESAHRSVYAIFDFIEKFHDFDSRFKKDIKEIIKRDFDNDMLHYETSNVELDIYYKNILYIYRDTEDRKLVIVTPSNKYIVSMTIKGMLALLDKRFVQCHRSCIMNTDKVEEKNYKNGYFKLINGEVVYMLSKNFKEEVSK